MTRTEFEEQRAQLACRQCGQTGTLSIYPHPSDPTHPGGLQCDACGSKQGGLWLSKDRAENHRPPLKRGTTDQVWKAWGGCCAHCGLTESELEVLGSQQQSASWMKRLKSLVGRLQERTA